MKKDNEKELNTEEKKDNINSELQDLIEDNKEKNDCEEGRKTSFGKGVFVNILDQLIILAGSSVILLIADVVMRIFGYQFVRETGSLLSVFICVYFVINCFYVQLMERTKLKNTIAKRILNL